MLAKRNSDALIRVYAAVQALAAGLRALYDRLLRGKVMVQLSLSLTIV